MHWTHLSTHKIRAHTLLSANYTRSEVISVSMRNNYYIKAQKFSLYDDIKCAQQALLCFNRFFNNFSGNIVICERNDPITIWARVYEDDFNVSLPNDYDTEKEYKKLSLNVLPINCDHWFPLFTPVEAVFNAQFLLYLLRYLLSISR